MSNDVLVKMVEQYQTFLESAIKANQLSVSSVEALVHFQMNASVSRLDSYMSLARAAADINDIASYQAFLAKQVDTSLTLQHKFSDDAKTLAEMMNNFKAEFDKVTK
jgi:phasin family protein